MAISRTAQQQQVDLFRVMAVQTGLELAQLGKRRENEDYLDYGVRVETMIDKLTTLLVNAQAKRVLSGQRMF